MKDAQPIDPEFIVGCPDTAPHGRVPAWAMSIVLHAVGLMMLALLMREGEFDGGGEPDRSVGIAMVKMVDGQREYYPAESSDAAAPSSTESQSTGEALPEASDLPFDLSGALPSSENDILSGSLGEALPGATEMSEETGHSSGPIGDSAETSIFGIKGEGTEFIYVFDRSGSMDGRPLRASKRALLASLDDLGDTHRFQIIFYNETPRPFVAAGDIPRLYFGDDRGTGLAKRFVERMTASGATRHMPALEMGLRLHPDVIFFLTDADEPQLSPDELIRVERLNQGLTVIHAIEFGYGPSPGGNDFLRQLAQRNGGQHTYVDVSRLPR